MLTRVGKLKKELNEKQREIKLRIATLLPATTNMQF